ncbi:MAG TPA: hypothetical protein DCZ94_07580 [Lentisphaeria bacterium]|nr:MAG: hypothetical protein A2X48_14255 [Lentisphaerae bacterium GWF2_49_21]HBC86797.1 hypothetical protein [Lentisphaeria bacterium]
MKFIISILFSALFPWQAFSQAQSWHPGIFRVNTTVSAGNEGIETVASKAERNGLEFVVFSDQFLVRGEYGLPPFRNILKKGMDRQSIISYGIEDYLRRIEDAGKKIPGMVLVPGADIAPHYYWKGSPFRNNLMTRQFSEQLTVFGSSDPEFYRKLPVIHNNYMFFSFSGFIVSLLPIIISAIGLLVLLSLKKTYYSDAQGNKYVKHKILKIISGIILILLGIIWCIDNKPLSYHSGFSQYSNYGPAPYQKVIDYIRKNGGDSAGVIWSAPEATMKDKIAGISLLTLPYLADIGQTYGHNGFAGIYGDAFHAHEPGKTWDVMLREYCSGKRTVRPVIVGEADYHGRGDISFIQTVINSKKMDQRNVTSAILSGRSYAVSSSSGNRLVLQNATVENGICICGPGELVKFSPRFPIVLNIKGKVQTENRTEKYPGEIKIIVDGKEFSRKKINLDNFTLLEQIPASEFDKGLSRHYIRFYISGGAGFLIANPIFIEL